MFSRFSQILLKIRAFVYLTMKNCPFCQRDKIKSDILMESENFFVKVGVGILAPGHVMVITREHLSCFAELPNHLMKEFILL